MKRVLLAIGVFVFALVALSACGGRNAELEPEIIHENALPFLEDLEYFQVLLEENFSLLDAAQRLRGVDFDEMISLARADIIDAGEGINRNIFGNILVGRFMPFKHVGHFWIVDELIITNESRALIRQLTSEHESEPQLPIAQTVRAMEVLEAGFWEREDVIRWLSERIHGDVAEAMFEALISSGVDLALEVYAEWAYGRCFADVTTEIIIEDEVAYIGFRNFLFDLGDFEEYIHEFYERIKGFDHLIVDLRNNPGGFPFFGRFVIAPNITQPLRAEGLVFFREGNRNIREMLQRLDFMGHMELELFYETWLPKNEALNKWGFPKDLVIYDIARLEYANRFYREVHPALLSRFDYRPAFDGKIWVLVDEFLGSAAQIDSWFVHGTGFATLVGNTTGGNYGGERIFVRLPNSRIEIGFDLLYMTDSNGRVWEAGTIPHHFNRPGVDALQTVLAIIEDCMIE